MQKIYSRFLIPLVLIFSFFRLGCLDIPGKLVMPQWDVDLNVPVIDRSYALNDIIKHQNYISIQDSGTPQNIYLIQSDKYYLSKDVSSFVQAVGTENTHSNVVSGSGSNTLFVQFPGGVTITKAVFSSGTLSYTFNNPSAQSVTIALQIPGVSINGNVFSRTIQIGAFGSVTDNIDFAGAVYNLPANQPSFFANSLEIILSASSSTPTVTDVNLTTTNFYFSTATGFLPAKSLGVKSSSFSLDISNAKDYRDKVTLKNADLNLDAVYIPAAANNNPFQIEVKNLSITGIRNDGTQLQLTIPDSAKTFIFSGTAKHFDFNASNSSITNFITFLPDSISVSAEYIMNPNNLNGTVAAGDSVKFTANFSTTSFMAINNTSMTDTSSIGDISDQDRTKIRAAQNAYLTVNIKNSIPLNATIKVDIADSLYHTLFTLTNGTTNTNLFSITPANVDQNGEVTSQGSSNFTVQMDSTQTEKFSHAQYAIYTVGVQTPNSPSPVAVRPSDVIQIQVYGGIKFRINNDNLK